MTGFGAARLENDRISVNAEIKTLNSKYLDAIVRLPNIFSSKEIEVKNLLSKHLQRGKAVLVLNYSSKLAVSQVQVNKDVVKNYYTALKETADELNAPGQDIFRLVMQMPEAYSNTSDEETLEVIWKDVEETIMKAVANCNNFRLQEGEALSKQLEGYIQEIASLLEKVKARDPERIAHIKAKLHKQVEDFVNSDNFDANRFEQELIYYIEKLDINEEKVRLKNHLDYFIETLNSPNSNGKKLGFISQEIGREINTIGSKANDAEIQKLVVNMKEELEKIKEQVLNIV